MLLACRNFSSFFSFSLGSLVLFSFLSFSVEEGREGTKKRSSGPRHLNLDNRKRDKRWKEGDPTSNNTERKAKRRSRLTGQATIQFLIKVIGKRFPITVTPIRGSKLGLNGLLAHASDPALTIRWTSGPRPFGLSRKKRGDKKEGGKVVEEVVADVVAVAEGKKEDMRPTIEYFFLSAAAAGARSLQLAYVRGHKRTRTGEYETHRFAELLYTHRIA